MKSTISELNGYLHSLRRLCKESCDFWAEVIDVKESVNQSIQNYIAQFEDQILIKSTRDISFSDVELLLEKYIFSNLTITNPDQLKLLAWDIVEYYGAAALDQSFESHFNPLVSNGAIQLTVDSSFHKTQVYYVVKIGNKLIITGLGIRA
ncbi:MAG: hypothetical protein HRU20_08925 [Pseudomonadales bacterium]|nr:hypothetical protein [Pseudomonadales bacterium]